MSKFTIYNKDCLGEKNGTYYPFCELVDDSVDVVLTSPPYNNGNCSYRNVLKSYSIEEPSGLIVNEFTDNYSIIEYKNRLKAVFLGVFRVLKPDGIFILDINKDVFCCGEHFLLYSYVKNIGIETGFKLFKEYPYQITGEHCVGHGNTQIVMLFVKTEEGKSKYAYLNVDTGIDTGNPLREEYDFSKSMPREVCWPSELLFDFIEVFQLNERKVILDPFSGESALGLIISSSNGRNASRYIGYEIVDKVANRALECNKREFGFESFFFERVFREVFEVGGYFNRKWQLSYIGAIVLDWQSTPFTCDIHYAQPTDEFRRNLEGATKKISDKKLPYLGSILGRKSDTDSEINRVFIYREHGCVFVRYGVKSIFTDKEFEQRFGLKGNDLACFRLHCTTLSKDGEFISFIPMVFKYNSFVSILYYIVACGKSYAYNKVLVMSNEILQKCYVASSSLLERRIKTLIGRFYSKSVRSAIGSIMSRNGSHNIGSHVLAALSHNVGTMPDDRLLYQYIQHRMDYIATATTDFPTWSGETKLVNGLIRRFLSQRHLLDHIAGSEGLHSFKFQDPNVSGRARREQTDTIKLHIRRKDAKGTIISDFITEDNETNGGSVVDKLKNDISVAMPGGVIGAHAFFTILENVIRNAAKHGWARQKDDKQNQGAKAENLDIYVDFILDADGKNITVTIFDNISDVFSVFDDSKMTANEKVWLNKYRDNLKDDKEGDGTKNKRAAVVDFLAGKGNVESLPVAYKEQHKILSARTPEELKDIADRLMGEVPSDGSIGNRLWLPLHHSQDIKLRQSFIDDAGTLRRENWGLAEMKISAGYLNKRSISDIGGITEGLPIVTPVCVEQQETVRGKDDQVPKRHLGYQFKIPRPREIAFVCDRAKISQAKIDQLQTLGIFVTPLPEEMKFFKPKNEGDNDWNYSYVVLPSFPKQENPHLPFRVLVKDKSGCKCPDMVPGATFYDTIVARLQSDESAETIAESLKKEVYRTWIDYWCKKRGFGVVDYSTRPLLRIMPTEVTDSGRSNQGLVSNYEVWDFVFKEMFRSIVGDLLQKADAGEFFVAEDVYWYLAILAVMPKSLGENGSVFTFKDEDDALRAKINDDSNKTDHHERELIFRQLNQWFDEFQGLINDKDSRFELRPALQEFSSKYVLKFGRQNDSATNNTIDSESGIHYASVFNKEVMKAVENRHFNMDDNPLWGTADSDNGLICFLSELCSAYREADVMLRKYEERIVSLPAFLGESQTPNKKQGEETNAETIKRFEGTLKDEKNGLGIALHYGITSANWSGRAIVFARHAKSDDYSHERMVYFEPLSGTQSYLYELMQLPQSDSSDQILTRMYETGLSRILIIDERVAKFLRSRPDEIKTFCRMGIWCVDEKKFGVAKEVDNKEKIPPIEMLDSLIELNKEKFDALIGAAVDEEAAVGKNEFSQNDLICNEVRDRGKVKFDILVIHQGLIDKWLPQAETNSKRVESFIHVLRTIIPYVVITTGRGTPANTPDSARILPFPVLEATLFKKYPEKMVLVDTIMNILPLGAHK